MLSRSQIDPWINQISSWGRPPVGYILTPFQLLRLRTLALFSPPLAVTPSLWLEHLTKCQHASTPSMPHTLHRLSGRRTKQGVGLPRKYLGHGICDARSKLLNLGRATADAGALNSHALQLLRESKVPPGKIRGIGLQMTRLGPSIGAGAGSGGGDGVGAGADGGSAAFGALHGWLIKPGGEDGGRDSSTKSAAATTPTTPGKITAVDDHATPSSMRKGTEGDGASSSPSLLSSSSSSPTVPKGLSLHSLAAEENVAMDQTEDREMTVLRQQKMTALDAAAGPSAASRDAQHGNKHPRGEDGETAPCNARPSPRRRSDTQSVSGASSASTPAVGARPGAVDEAKARSPIDVPGSARKQKAARTDNPGKPEQAVGVLSSTSTGGGATPSRVTEHEPGVVGGAAFSQEGVGGGFSSPSAVRRLTNHPFPHFPEFLSPPTPAARVVATPSTGAAGSPSLSQVRELDVASCSSRCVIGPCRPS